MKFYRIMHAQFATLGIDGTQVKGEMVVGSLTPHERIVAVLGPSESVPGDSTREAYRVLVEENSP